MDFNSTVKGSLLEGFYPEGWDFEKIDKCCSHAPEEVFERQSFWNEGAIFSGLEDTVTGRSYGNVQVGCLFSARVERLVRERLVLQYG